MDEPKVMSPNDEDLNVFQSFIEEKPAIRIKKELKAEEKSQEETTSTIDKVELKTQSSRTVILEDNAELIYEDALNTSQQQQLSHLNVALQTTASSLADTLNNNQK